MRTCCSPKPSMSIAPRPAKCSMRPGPLEGALRVDAAGVALALGADQRRRPRAGAGAWGTPTAAPVRVVAGQHRPDDLGDDVAGPAHDHGVAGADVLERDLVLVVEGGLRRRWRRRRTPARARRTAWPARCGRPRPRCRAGGWCAPRAGTCRRSPSRGACEVEPERPAPGQVVDLHHRAVDLVGRARGGAPASGGSTPAPSSRVCSTPDLGVHRQADLGAGSRASRGGGRTRGPPSTSPSW